MEFIKQIVAFAILAGAGEKLLTKSRDNLEDFWILASNTREEAMLLQTLNDDERRLYQLWVDKHLGGVEALKEEPEPRQEPSTPEELGEELGKLADEKERQEPGPVLVCQGGCGRTTEGMTDETIEGEFVQEDETLVSTWTCPDCLAKKETPEPEPTPVPPPQTKKSTKRK